MSKLSPSPSVSAAGDDRKSAKFRRSNQLNDESGKGSIRPGIKPGKLLLPAAGPWGSKKAPALLGPGRPQPGKRGATRSCKYQVLAMEVSAIWLRLGVLRRDREMIQNHSGLLRGGEKITYRVLKAWPRMIEPGGRGDDQGGRRSRKQKSTQPEGPSLESNPWNLNLLSVMTAAKARSASARLRGQADKWGGGPLIALRLDAAGGLKLSIFSGEKLARRARAKRWTVEGSSRRVHAALARGAFFRVVTVAARSDDLHPPVRTTCGRARRIQRRNPSRTQTRPSACSVSAHERALRLVQRPRPPPRALPRGPRHEPLILQLEVEAATVFLAVPREKNLHGSTRMDRSIQLEGFVQISVNTTRDGCSLTRVKYMHPTLSSRSRHACGRVIEWPGVRNEGGTGRAGGRQDCSRRSTAPVPKSRKKEQLRGMGNAQQPFQFRMHHVLSIAILPVPLPSATLTKVSTSEPRQGKPAYKATQFVSFGALGGFGARASDRMPPSTCRRRAGVLDVKGKEMAPG
ncbi:hypothetical protein C8R46DRAFT_1040513 [Mycena filopes]|nr:hypothetical protein C8R46DRAFT_1040513 [Mycena filopes]